MNLIRGLIFVTTWTVLAVIAVVYALVQDHTVVGVISAPVAVVLGQVLYRLSREAADAVSESENAKVAN